MHLDEPHVPTPPASYLGTVTLTVNDPDGTGEPSSPSGDPLVPASGVGIHVKIHLISADGLEVAGRSGDPDYMPADWQARAIALINELRAATAIVQGLDAAPPSASPSV
jgi:hypothetical protein